MDPFSDKFHLFCVISEWNHLIFSILFSFINEDAYPSHPKVLFRFSPKHNFESSAWRRSLPTLIFSVIMFLCIVKIWGKEPIAITVCNVKSYIQEQDRRFKAKEILAMKLLKSFIIEPISVISPELKYNLERSELLFCCRMIHTRKQSEKMVWKMKVFIIFPNLKILKLK